MRAVQLPRALAAPQEVAAAVVPVLTGAAQVSRCMADAGHLTWG